VRKLVVTVLQPLVAVNVANVQSRVVLKPFQITALVGELNREWMYPLVISVLLKRLVLLVHLFQQVTDGFLPLLVIVARLSDMVTGCSSKFQSSIIEIDGVLRPTDIILQNGGKPKLPSGRVCAQQSIIV
jgi:hypothetical protein